MGGLGEYLKAAGEKETGPERALQNTLKIQIEGSE
jgi:hypothetical protein